MVHSWRWALLAHLCTGTEVGKKMSGLMCQGRRKLGKVKLSTKEICLGFLAGLPMYCRQQMLVRKVFNWMLNPDLTELTLRL